MPEGAGTAASQRNCIPVTINLLLCFRLLFNVLYVEYWGFNNQIFDVFKENVKAVICWFLKKCIAFRFFVFLIIVSI